MDKQRLIIALQTYPDGGGISSNVENYVSELKNEYDLHVAIVDERECSHERLALPKTNVHVMGYSNAINALLAPTSGLFAITVSRFLRRLVKRLSPDALIVQDALNLPVPGVIATSRRRTKLVIMDHGTLTNVYDPAWLPIILRRLGRKKRLVFRIGFIADAPWRAVRWRIGVRFADALWYTGEELRPWFEQAGDRAREYSQSVPRDFAPATKRERAAARRELGLPDDAIVMNVIGRLDGEKGIDTIVDALGDFRGDRRGWIAVFAGDGSLDSWLRHEIQRRRLASHVRILGRLERSGVRRVQQASDFHLYAGTISCGVSVCLLEAMAAGVIPIVSDVPALQRELVRGAGWCFRAGDTDELKNALREGLSLTAEERIARSNASRTNVNRAINPTIPELLTKLLRDA